MCTAATYKTNDFYFGRTLDYESSYGEEIVIMPRGFQLKFVNMGIIESHYAVIGVAHVAQNYPLFYDAANEKGLAMAGLNFVGNAFYHDYTDGSDNVAVYSMDTLSMQKCGRSKKAYRKGKHNKNSIQSTNAGRSAPLDNSGQDQLHCGGVSKRGDKGI